MKIYGLNERTMVVEIDGSISLEASSQVTSLLARLEEADIPGVSECWPTYGSVGVQFDPEIIPPKTLESRLRDLARVRSAPIQSGPNTVTIPVKYHTAKEPDMQLISQSLLIPPAEIAAIHAGGTYVVAMLGFLPGFPYLIGLPETLHHPRKDKPSLRIPGGAVAIGGTQTGIYPHAGPGGWYVIGHTEQQLFDPPSHFLLSPGDVVKFEPT